MTQAFCDPLKIPKLLKIYIVLFSNSSHAILNETFVAKIMIFCLRHLKGDQTWKIYTPN